MEKGYELFVLSAFKIACDNLATQLINYSNEYNEILTKIRNNNSKIVTLKDKKDVEHFYEKMINNEELMKNLNHVWKILSSLTENKN